MNTTTSRWRTYRRLLGYTAGHWRVLAWAVTGMVVDAGCTTLFAKLIKPMLDRLFIDKDASTIFWMPLWIVGIFAARGLASYAGDYGMAHVGRSVVQAMREAVFDAYLTLPVGAFSAEPGGTQVARITYTCEQIAQASTDAIKTLVIDGLTVCGLVGIMVYYSPLLTLSLAVLMPAVGVITTRVARSYRKVGYRAQGAMAELTGAVTELVDSLRDVRIFGATATERARFRQSARQMRRLNLKAASTSALSSALIQFIAALALALIIFIATRPRLLDTMSPGTFFAVLMAMGGILPSLKRLASVQSAVQRGVVAAEDLFAAIDAPPEHNSGTFALARSRGHVEFRNVRFGYDEAARAVLDDISLELPPGTVTALVGQSGSGKSTLASMVPRLLDPDSGSVRLDGQDLRDCELASVRRQVAWVGQSIALFDRSVAQNIAYGELANASESEIREAAHAANALEFIEQLPGGLHARVGPGGRLLSGGQRQRIAIARAILKDAPILILDEATAALDAESETLIRDALLRLMARRTTLVIAHHLSTVQHAQRIVLIEQGRILEQGTHDQLLDRGGRYAAFHRMQHTA